MQFLSGFTPPKITTSARDAATVAGRLPVGALIENISFSPPRLQRQQTAGTWVDVGESPGGSVTPMSHIAAPADNDTARQAFLVSLQSEMIAKGFMQPPPTYTISGQITGSIQAGITVELRDNGTNALLQTVNTDSSGNYSFTPRIAGTYRVTPSITGHYFTPNQAVITLSANTVQNFTAALITADGFAFVKGNVWILNGAASSISILNPLTNTITTSFPSNTDARRIASSDADNRVIIAGPSGNDIRIFDATTFAQVQQIINNYGNTQAMAIANGAFTVIGNSFPARIGFRSLLAYNFLSFNEGTAISPITAITHAGKIWVLSGNSVRVVDATTRNIITTITLPFSQASALGADGNVVLVGDNTAGTANKLTAIDATTNTIIRTFRNTSEQFQRRIASGGGKFFVPVNLGTSTVLVIDTNTITSGADPTIRSVSLVPAGGTTTVGTSGAVFAAGKVFIARSDNSIIVMDAATEVVNTTRITHASLNLPTWM